MSCPARPSRRVLIVEDEADIALSLKHNLERGGPYEVTTVGDGADALRAVASAPPDLVLLDLNLPGRLAARRAGRRHRRCRRRRCGRTWRLNGVKRFITNGGAEILLVLARTEPDSKDARGLSLFLVEADDTVHIRRLEPKLGLHSSPTCEREFRDTPAQLIGKRRMGLIRYAHEHDERGQAGSGGPGAGHRRGGLRRCPPLR